MVNEESVKALRLPRSSFKLTPALQKEGQRDIFPKVDYLRR
ncbi:unnamed protein product [Callosobruchus maculatus]|uniref:Uncharacterized protein n=1 Tax=Callosobruchus maculatus TaxID=64391 RepID=A0A653CF09_CALMS|nr:unnamed protein product [Callosobruchus maculatus]